MTTDKPEFLSHNLPIPFNINNILANFSSYKPATSHIEENAQQKNTIVTNEPLIQDKYMPKKINNSFTLESPSKVIKEARELADKAKNLMELSQSLHIFDGCQLKKTATNTVFGEGATDAKIMFIGEAPGANEDIEGRPFCGESGKLLDKMLAAIGLSRQTNFYITNTVFYRPPGNRQPTQQEIEICRPFVEKHIALIDPAIIVLVGSTAANSLIGNHVQITKIRKEYYDYTNCYLTKNIPVTAVFHPAYLLRQPLQKKTMWYDLLHLQDYLIKQKII